MRIVQCAVLLGLAFVACKKDDETTPPAQTAQQYPNGQYPQGTQQYPNGQYPQGTQQYPNGQYPQGTQQYPQQTQQYPQQTAPTTTAAPAGGQMATPGPLALPCTSDSACGFARCNVQYQKCAFPCASTELDCMPGSACGVGGLCMPGAK